MAGEKKGVLWKFLDVLRPEKQDIVSIYFYAILGGLVQLSLPLGIQSIISFMMGGAISTSLVLLIILVILGVFIAGLLNVNQMKLIEKIQQQLFVRYSFLYAYSIPRFDLQYVDNYYLPELVNRFSDTVSLQKSVAKLLLDVPTATIQILFGLILLSFYHPVFIFFSVALVVVLLLILIATADRGMQTSIEESNYKYKVMGYLEELARAIVNFKLLGNTTRHIVKTDGYVTGYLNARTAHFRILLFQYWTLIAFKTLITAAMLIVGAFLLVGQQLNIGQFIAAEIVILSVIGSVEKLIVNLEKVYDVMTSVEKLTKVTEKPLEANGDVQFVPSGKGISVRTRSLTFGYTENEQVLKGITLDIEPGQRICITGPSGAGKSTLLKLLSGLYGSFTGNLLMDEIPLRNYDLASLRRNIGIMLRRQDLFQGTLRENICHDEGEVSYRQLDMLSRLVGLTSFIESSPYGYERLIGPMGQRLSGKVVKQILLMRALYGQPGMLILENPWQGLSEECAAAIKNYIFTELKDVTVIISTNDEEYAATCDKTVVMENGTISQITERKRK